MISSACFGAMRTIQVVTNFEVTVEGLSFDRE
ncbi:hypothetical protein BH09MYX1_BH09MYX1_43010 [soil metagenome]